MRSSPNHRLQLLLVLGLVKDLPEDRIVDQLGDAEEFLLIRGEGYPVVDVDHHRGEDLHFSVKSLDGNENIRNRRILDLVGKLAGDLCACLGKDLAGARIDDILREDVIPDPVSQHELLVEFVAADLCEVISSRIKEHAVDKALRRIHCKRLARADLLVQFKKTVLIGVGRILREGGQQLRLLAEHLDDLLVRADAHRADQLCDRHFSRAVHTYIENVVGVGLILEPGAAVRDDRAGIQLLAELVVGDSVVDAR